MSKSENQKDFFISYTGIDEAWATWIAETLEKGEYTTIIQAWDFVAGGSFINDMNEALIKCKRVILVLSKAYLQSDYCKAEWQNVFASDSTGKRAKIIPVRIEDVTPEGLLAARTYINLFGLDEKEATKLLLVKVDTNPKERKSDGFPGNKVTTPFPGKLPTNNLPDRNIYFMGRTNILQTISARFKVRKNAVLTQSMAGLGGVGKTQIAVEYAYRNANKYQLIWFFHAETDMTLKSDVDKFLKLVSSKDTSAMTLQDVSMVFKNWMDENSGWLFIFDNAEDYDTLRPFLPRDNSGEGRVIITSRNQYWDKVDPDFLDIRAFEPNESLDFLRGRTKISDDDGNAKMLGELLGYLPIALEYAAAYIVENSETFSSYIEMYSHDKLELLRDGLSETQIPIDTTFNISMKKINNHSARQLLSICSCLAPNNINIDLLLLKNSYLPSPLKEDILNRRKRNAIIHDLKRYSLIEEKGGNIYIHRLLQEAIKSSLADDRTYLDACYKYLDEQMKILTYSTVESRDEKKVLLPHAVAVCKNLEAINMLDSCHNLCSNIAHGFYEFASYAEALEWYQKALVIREKVLGKEHLYTVDTYNNIAGVYYGQGDYKRALKWYHKALVIREKVLGKEHPDTAATYSGIADVYDSLSDYKRALEWYHKTLAIREKALGKEHSDTAATYNSIGGVYLSQGEYAEALKWYFKALAIVIKVLGEEHPHTAITYNNIALVYYRQGDLNRALRWYYKALAIFEKVLGKEHPYTATAYNNIALIYDRQSDYKRALEWHYKALAICEKVLGKEHPSTALTYDSIAGIYDSQGNYKRALEWGHKALEIDEKVLGIEHPYTAATYNNIADVYYKQGDYKRALELYHKALTIFEKVLGKEHPYTSDAYKNIASVYYQQGNYARALELFQKASVIREKVLGEEHLETADTYQCIAAVYCRQGNYAQALEYYQKTLVIREKVLGEEHPDTVMTYKDITVVYCKQGNYAKALEWCKKVPVTREKILGKKHPNTTTPYNDIDAI